MSVLSLIQDHRFVLGEGSLYERLRRIQEVILDPHFAHAGLIYDDRARDVLMTIHHEYLEIG